MSLVTIVISLIVVGVLLWLINTYIPMDGKIKKIINIVVVVVVVLWLLSVFGVIDHVRGIHVSSFNQSTSTCSLVSQPGLEMTPAVAITA
jgi:Fe2+ transport system protein B